MPQALQTSLGPPRLHLIIFVFLHHIGILYLNQSIKTEGSKDQLQYWKQVRPGENCLKQPCKAQLATQPHLEGPDQAKFADSEATVS